MKLENESTLFKSTLCDKPSSKASELNNDALDSERLKIENEENHDQSLCDQSGDMNLDNRLQCTIKDEKGWNPFKEDSSSIDSSDSDDVRAVNEEPFEKELELYTEKNVPECDLPELVVCLEESSCNIVKDICIDERINPCSSPVKAVFESDEDDHNDVMVKELEFTGVIMADELKILEESLSEKDSIDETDFNELIAEMVVECDQNDPNAKANLELEPCNRDDNDAVEEHSVEMSSEIENSPNPPSVSAGEESKKLSDESTWSHPGPEVDSVANDSPSGGETEKEALTFNLDERCEQGEDHNKIIRSESGKFPWAEDGSSSKTQVGVGESSFSSAAPLASLINYSSPVGYSGNLSIRSDSSTTSTRSFAFPILQTEWHHNSPVRMAKADRRFFRKHKGWRQGLFCCRF